MNLDSDGQMCKVYFTNGKGRLTMAMIKLAAHLASVHGFLEMYRLAPHADAFYLTWLFFVAQGIGAAVNKLTVGDSGAC